MVREFGELFFKIYRFKLHSISPNISEITGREIPCTPWARQMHILHLMHRYRPRLSSTYNMMSSVSREVWSLNVCIEHSPLFHQNQKGSPFPIGGSVLAGSAHKGKNMLSNFLPLVLLQKMTGVLNSDFGLFSGARDEFTEEAISSLHNRVAVRE